MQENNVIQSDLNYSKLESNDKTVDTKLKKIKKIILIGLGLFIIFIILIVILIFALGTDKNNDSEKEPDIPYSEKIIMNSWGKNTEDNVYYMVGLRYVNNSDEIYQKFGLYIPKEYFNCLSNNNKRFTCEINNNTNTINGYTSFTAPIVFSIDTPGYSPAQGPTNYDKLKKFKKYTDQGFVYIQPGCRGNIHGAPLGIVDLKAVITYIKEQKGILPGNVDRIFSMGMSGGGAQSFLMGVSGNAKVFESYLNELNVKNDKNDIYGSMSWCPITNLEIGNEAYEWNLGLTRDNLEDSERKLSIGLAKEFAKYINNEKFKDELGNVLRLESSESEETEDMYYFQKGSYYEYIKKEVEQSFSNWVHDTTFPYTKNEQIIITNKNDEIHSEIEDTIPSTRTFQNLSEYIDYLNEGNKWIEFDNKSNKTKITNIKSFAKKCKKYSKGIGAYDDLYSKNTTENILFGLPDKKETTTLHFDILLGKLAGKEKEFEEDMKNIDSFGNNVTKRLLMYSPLSYIKANENSEFSSNIAKYWRIRTGLFQGDTSLCTEINLKLALLNKKDKIVDFETVWEAVHELAERGKKDPDDLFIEWVNSIMKN